MLKKLTSIFNKKKDERGSADVIVSVMLIPILLSLILVTINLATYFQNKVVIQDFARSAARIYSVDPNNAAAINNVSTTLNTSSWNRSSTGFTLNCGKKTGETAGVPTFTPGGIRIGDIVGCSISNYTYKSIFNDWFGFSALATTPLTIYSYAVSEVNDL